MFLFHSSAPVWVGKRATEGLGHWRQLGGGEERRYSETALRARGHGVLVAHWWDSNSTRRQGRSRTGGLGGDAPGDGAAVGAGAGRSRRVYTCWKRWSGRAEGAVTAWCGGVVEEGAGAPPGVGEASGAIPGIAGKPGGGPRAARGCAEGAGAARGCADGGAAAEPTTGAPGEGGPAGSASSAAEPAGGAPGAAAHGYAG